MSDMNGEQYLKAAHEHARRVVSDLAALAEETDNPFLQELAMENLEQALSLEGRLSRLLFVAEAGPAAGKGGPEEARGKVALIHGGLSPR